jgi:hypothetical protein
VLETPTKRRRPRRPSGRSSASYGNGVMRTKSFILAFIAATIVPTLPASAANVGCIITRLSYYIDRLGYPRQVTSVQASTHAGQPCHIQFGSFGEIAVLQTVHKPSHGVVNISAKEGSHRHLDYVPSPGFVGRDQFEVHIVRIPLGGGTRTGNVQGDVTQ